MPKSKRYYVHGDLHESEEYKYFCFICDTFELASHFSQEDHLEKRSEKYKQSLDIWRNRKISTKTFFRPNSANNFLADDSAADFRAQKARQCSFYKWLVKNEGRDDIIGDLASDVLHDKTFPVNSKSEELLLNYTRSKGGCAGALTAVSEALLEYKNRSNPRSVLTRKLRFEILKRDNYKCTLCGKSPEDGIKLEVDHKHPIAKGGTSQLNNLHTLCFDCNRGKSISSL